MCVYVYAYVYAYVYVYVYVCICVCVCVCVCVYLCGRALGQPPRSSGRPHTHAASWSAAPRSGLAWKSFIDVGAGVIDADYRGNVGVLLFNHAETDFVVKKGDRVAQFILERIYTPQVHLTSNNETVVACSASATRARTLAAALLPHDTKAVCHIRFDTPLGVVHGRFRL